MRTVLILENDEGDQPGYLGDALAAASVPTELVRVHAGDPVPPLPTNGAVVILGGSMGVYEADEYPWIEEQAELVRDAVAADVPVLGICLGAQIIAHALGGHVYLAERPEVGVIEATLTPAGIRDPLGEHLAGPYLVFHQDTFRLPPEAELLAASDRFPQVFRCGSALAVQPHPEVSAEVATSWGQRSPLPERAGIDLDAELTRMRAEVPPERALALFAAWIDSALR